jgi:hypothetical protein
MPRDGTLALSDVSGPMLTIVCEPCGRRGQYNVERLMAEHGDAKLTNLLTTLQGHGPPASTIDVARSTRGLRYASDRPTSLQYRGRGHHLNFRRSPSAQTHSQDSGTTIPWGRPTSEPPRFHRGPHKWRRNLRCTFCLSQCTSDHQKQCAGARAPSNPFLRERCCPPPCAATRLRGPLRRSPT